MNLSNAADTLQRLANQQSGLVEAYQALQDLGGLDNAKTELTAQVEQLRADVAAKTQEYLDITHQTEDAKTQADSDKDTAAKVASALVDAAHKQADDIAIQAASNAALLEQAAKDQAAQIIADANATVQTLQAKSEELLVEIKKSQATKDAIDAACADAQSKIDSIKAQISKLVA